jgi:tRNA (cmo5U34)-methyltransferase
MTEFNKSNWANAEFSKEYIDNADICIVERRRSHGIVKSFYKHFLKDKPQRRILDLGCGDGVITYELLKVGDYLSATLVDGSADMLEKAKNRLEGFADVYFISASFQEILARNILQADFDFIVSSLSIHHLTMDEKELLFQKIYSCLNSDGYFLNVDVILAPTESLEQWYMSLWQEWIAEKKALLGIESNYGDDTMRRYKENKDNKPDTLDDQMNALKAVGFKEVDCFYKYGIFTIFGGKK